MHQELSYCLLHDKKKLVFLDKGYCLLGVCFLWNPYQAEQLLHAGTAVEHKLFNVWKEFTHLYDTKLLILPYNLIQTSETFLSYICEVPTSNGTGTIILTSFLRYSSLHLKR
jgi:hypothetical protein